ncbi:MAG: alkaline phosphatase family protein [Candidatus Krumholzibacteria bacterium]|nr:alkaline phosphatase family protein [Candidatus Krumholzibacteria bacterium]
MKKYLLPALGVAVIAVVLGSTIKRVPNGHQAILIGKKGMSAGYGAGTHFVRPFAGPFIIYPVGEVEYRYPDQGAYPVLSGDGVDVSVAVSLRLEVPPGTAQTIYSTLGEDFYSGSERIVKETVEIETANFSVTSTGAMPDGFAEAIVTGIAGEVTNAGFSVMSCRVDEWQVSGDVLPLSVDPRPLRKVVFVGVDGADWHIIDELIAQNRLPNFKKLVREGASGPLTSIEPLLSPLIWTTMATGRLPEEHGILNFTVADPETGKKLPISRLYRKVDAFWNILSDYHRSVDVIGWLATFPAEPISGVMVTDRFGYLAYADAGEATAGTVSPVERMDELRGLVTPSTSVSYEEFYPFVHLDRAAFIQNRSSAFDPKNPISSMLMLYASAKTYRRITNHLFAGDQPDFLATYFELVDATKHLFMHYAPPRRPHVDESGYEINKDAVTAAYVMQDSIIGEFIDKCDDNTVLIVASDHGFKSGESRPQQRPEIWAGKAAFWHRLDGIICLYGNGIRTGFAIEGASILDIAPTFLALQGLPKPQDMPGKILESAFADVLASRVNRSVVSSLDREREVDDLALTSGGAATDEALKKLEALGYITPDNPDAYNNLGQRYQEQGRYSEAIAEFEKALAINPNFPGALNNLGVCYGKLKQYDKAEASLKKAIQLNPEDVYAMNNLAVMFMSLKQLDRARRYSEESVAIEPKYANGHLTLGSIYATMGLLDLAETEFEKALVIDPANRSAQVNLDKVRSQLKAN